MTRVALVGNPNAGKTTLFNALSGLRQRVGNYPGVTVEMKTGSATIGGETVELIDLPGTYSLAPRSPDEMVAVDLLLGRAGEPPPDVVLAIADASNIDRHLYLVTQLLELGRPVVLALNMIDVADAQGVRIDHAALSRRLGLSVVPIRANAGVGLEALKTAVATAAVGDPPPRGPKFPEAFDREVAELAKTLGPDVPPYLVERLLLDVGGHTERRFADEFGPGVGERVAAARQRLRDAGHPVPAVEAKARYTWIRDVTAACVSRPATRPVTTSDRLDRLLTHKLWGTLIFLAMMFAVFQAIFTGARPLMDLIGEGQKALSSLAADHLPPGPLTDLLTDGVLTGVGGVLVFLPQILILFGFVAVLEDCGYMARAAFLMDKLMAKCGLNGKSFIPLLSSVACAVPGIMATRVIENRRDRLATILVAPLMSCSARLPLYVLLIGAFLTPGRPWWVPGLAMFVMYMIGFVTAPLVALALKRTLLRGETPVFVMEMPSYKRPSLRTVVRRMVDAAWAFVRRAGTLILASMVLVWALLYFPYKDAEGKPWAERIVAAGAESDAAKELRAEWTANSYLGRFGHWLEPAVRPLGWDWRVGVAALASFPAREVVVGTLGIVYRQGDVDTGAITEGGVAAAGETPLGQALKAATWPDGRPVFTLPAVLSLLVFFALCCQCASTLAVIKRETGGWRWPAFTFAYMTALAYVGALVVYQVGSRLG